MHRSVHPQYEQGLESLTPATHGNGVRVLACVVVTAQIDATFWVR